MNLALDLYCGLGGWAEGFTAEGWRIVGVDCADFRKQYPGEFVRANVLRWTGWQQLRPRVVVASVPCEEYSRHCMPWTRAKNPPQPDLRLWHAAEFIAGQLGAPLVIECVRAAAMWHGPSKMNCVGRKKESFSSTARAERAKIPFNLARWVAQSYAKK